MTKITSPIQIMPHNVMSESSIQKADLGQIAYTTDGRKFRYSKAGGTALVAGTLQQASAIVANHQNLTCAAAALAATSVTVTLGATAATANQYADGYLVINDVDGEGHTYLIKSHPAADASATLVLTLYENTPITDTALTANSQACLVANKYNGVIQMPTTITGAAVGVPLFDVTASYFFWLQTRGAVSCLNGDADLTVGSAVSPSNATAGAVENGVIAQGFVGNALQAGVNTEYRTIDLMLD